MKKYFQKIWENKKVKKIAGVTLVVIGVLSIITPFTPVGFLLVLGLEILGVRMLAWDKFKVWWRKSKDSNI